MKYKCILLTILSLGSLFFGTLVYYFLPISNTMVRHITHNEILFLDIMNIDNILYNILSTNNGTYLLTRMIDSIEGRPIMVQTLLDLNFYQISDWYYVSNYNFSLLDVRNNTNYDSFNYSWNSNHFYTLTQINNIINPSRDRILNYTTEHILAVKHNQIIDPKCLLDLVVESMKNGKDKSATGRCDSMTVIAFPGTDFENTQDILSNIKGPIDYYRSAFENIDNFEYRKYDICTGYSLGGAITKYLSTLGEYCTSIVTFGSLLTEHYNNNIPIIEYINVMDYPDGCCEINWIGECNKRGMILADPVTHLVKGFHHNVKYINKHENVNKLNVECVGSFIYTIWKTEFTLHNIGTYKENL